MSLHEVFRLLFNLRFNSVAAFDKVSDILSVCLASNEAMTVNDLFQCVRALSVSSQVSSNEFGVALESLTGFLVRRADDSVMFFHPSFREWLLMRREQYPGDQFQCDPAVGHLGKKKMMNETLVIL